MDIIFELVLTAIKICELYCLWLKCSVIFLKNPFMEICIVLVTIYVLTENITKNISKVYLLLLKCLAAAKFILQTVKCVFAGKNWNVEYFQHTFL